MGSFKNEKNARKVNLNKPTTESIRSAEFRARNAKAKAKRIAELKAFEVPGFDESLNVNEVAAKIDTTLTPEQREHVEKIKKMIKGGINTPRCKYIY